MIKIRRADDRGHFDHGWLNTYHTFSFASYHDPAYMGFRSLRVINEDRVQPGTEFPTHPHRDMEIISYVISGELSHKDSMGTGSVIRPGEVQKMSAGRGVLHSERNNSKDGVTHFLQIWIIPSEKGIEPDYAQIKMDDAKRRNRLLLVGSPDDEPDAVRIHQDVRLFSCILEPGRALSYVLPETRHAWVQVVRGDLTLNGEKLAAGDGAAVSDEEWLEMAAESEAEFLLFDLA
jgi:redox-sensitive bicupin YhaK (pirin superfamily)